MFMVMIVNADEIGVIRPINGKIGLTDMNKCSKSPS